MVNAAYMQIGNHLMNQNYPHVEINLILFSVSFI